MGLGAMVMPGLNLMANLLPRYREGIYPFAGVDIGWSWAEIKANILEEKRGTVCDAVPLAAHSIPGNFTWWPCEQ